MADNIKTKKSFGSVRGSRFSPPLPASVPKAINIHISFEEDMRLHLGLAQALGKLNAYDRSTKRGRQTAVNLCLYTEKSRITINEGVVRDMLTPDNGEGV
jgi:hypothetical protein